MIKNRIICTVLIFALMCTTFAFAAEENTDVEKEVFVASEEFEIVRALGIYDTEIAANETVTRAGVLGPVLRMLGLTDIALQGEQLYVDVTGGHKNFNEIYMASRMGIINGDGAGRFFPDDSVDFPAALKIVVSALGYTPRAQSCGGYPAGYIQVAQREKMLQELDMAENRVTYDALAKIIVNCFDVKLMQAIRLDEANDMYSQTGETVLDNLGIEEITGIVTENSVTALGAPSSCSYGYARIGDLKVKEQADVGKYLGYNVRAFVKSTNTDSERIAYYAVPWDNNVLSVDARDINSDAAAFSLTKFCYYDEKGKSETANIKTGADIIANGIVCADRSLSVIAPAAGSVTLVDNTDDRKYDVILVNDTEDYVVDTLNTEMLRIFDKFGKTLDIGSDDTSLDLKIVNQNGENVNFSSLKEWDVLTVADSRRFSVLGNYRCVSIVVCTQVVAGTVESEESEIEGTTHITVDGQRFALSDSYDAGNSNSKLTVPTLGDSGNYHLNVRGEIAAYNKSSLDKIKKTIGYFIAAKSKSGLSTDVQVKIYNQINEVKILSLADKIELDGVKITKEEFFADCENGKYTPQIVQYRVNNEGYLDYLDTANIGISEDANTLKQIYDDTEPQLYYRTPKCHFSFKIWTDGATVFFNIPENLADEDFVAGNQSLFAENTNYSIEAYTSRAGSLTASVIVSYETKDKEIDNRKSMIVEKLTNVLDEEGNEVEKVYGYDSWGTVEYISDENIFSKNKVGVGDVIQVRQKLNKKVTYVDLIYDYSEDKFKSDSNPSGNFGTYNRMMYGSVWQKDGELFALAIGNPSDTDSLGELEKKLFSEYTNAWVFNKDTEKIRRATVDDLLDYQYNGEACTKVVAFDRNADSTALFLYNQE